MEHKTDRLRMPEHGPGDGVPNADTRDLWMNGKGVICRASTEPGYALMMDAPGYFGHLHCNRCGFVTPEQVVLTYSPDTGHHYLTWEDLIAAEANGWVVIGTSSRRDTVPVVVGPFDTQEDARKARTRLRRKWQREERLEHGSDVKITTHVRVLWKENRS